MLIRFIRENDTNCKRLVDFMNYYKLKPDEDYVIDETNQRIANSYQVTVYPTLVLADDDDSHEEFDRVEGSDDMTKVAKFLHVYTY